MVVVVVVVVVVSVVFMVVKVLVIGMGQLTRMENVKLKMSRSNKDSHYAIVSSFRLIASSRFLTLT